MDKDSPAQFGRAMAELGTGMIAGYSPQARGRRERLFGTLQGRLPQELAKAGSIVRMRARTAACSRDGTPNPGCHDAAGGIPDKDGAAS